VPLAPVGFNLIEAPPHVSPFSFRSCVPPAVGWVLAPRPSPRPKPPNQLLPPGFSAMLPQRLTLDFRGFPSRESVHLLVVLPTVQGRSSSRFTGPRTSLQEQPTAGLPFWPDRRSNSYSRSCHRFFASGLGNSAFGALPWTSSVGCLWPKPETDSAECPLGIANPLEESQAHSCHSWILQLPSLCDMARSRPRPKPVSWSVRHAELLRTRYPSFLRTTASLPQPGPLVRAARHGSDRSRNQSWQLNTTGPLTSASRSPLPVPDGFRG
jgi:hypothetical protein